MTTDDRRAEDLYGWKEDESVSKDLPGRFTSRSKLVAATTLPEPAAAVLAAEDRPLSRRNPCVDLKFQAIGELSRHLKNRQAHFRVSPLITLIPIPPAHHRPQYSCRITGNWKKAAVITVITAVITIQL